MNSLEKQGEMISRLIAAGISTVDKHIPFPRPFYHDRSKVRAIYLGCDPSNTKKHKRFTHVFALPNGDECGFGRFVRSHRESLGQVGLSWETVYVQNLCQNYFTEETSKNFVDWKKAASIWIHELKKELRVFKKDIPVILTAEVLYTVLLKPGAKSYKAIEFYKHDRHGLIPIPPEENHLGRPLIPLYRHWRYNLSKWKKYRVSVTKYLETK